LKLTLLLSDFCGVIFVVVCQVIVEAAEIDATTILVSLGVVGGGLAAAAAAAAVTTRILPASG